MGLFSDEESARDAWASAFEKYFESATAGIVPVVPSALATPQSDMADGMTGLSVTGPLAIQAGVSAFWTALAAIAVTAFPLSTTVTPPAGITSLSATLTAVFSSNIVGLKSQDASYDAIATAIHSACAGGIAIFSIPPGGIGPQTIL
jgi:hypothetical protein